jgi:hypothetical protein
MKEGEMSEGEIAGIFFGLFFDPEDRGDMILQNVG